MITKDVRILSMVPKDVLILRMLENTPPKRMQEAVKALTSGEFTIALQKAADGEIQGRVTFRDGNERSVSYTGYETETHFDYTLTCWCGDTTRGYCCQHATALALAALYAARVAPAALQPPHAT